MSPRTVPQGFAGGTDVAVERSKVQIEMLLQRYGAEGYHTGWQAPAGEDPGWDAIEFLWKGKQIRFRLPRYRTTDKRVLAYGGRDPQKYMQQLDRQRWRILHLVIKAKLEAVEAGVTVFEDEFLAHIVTGSGRTIGEILLPRIAAMGSQLQLEEGRQG